MLTNVDFRDRDYSGSRGQKDNDKELRRLKSLCAKESVDFSNLVAAARYGKLLAITFSSTFGAKMFEREFNKIGFDGDHSDVWSEITKGKGAGTRTQFLPYMIAVPKKEETYTKMTFLSCLDLIYGQQHTT